jgi:hypothetical protein
LALMTMPSVAPLGGALADGDPHRELPLVAMALGSTHQRELAIEDLFSGYSETVLGKRSAELAPNGEAATDRLPRKVAEAAIGGARTLVTYKRKQLRGHVRRAIRAVPNPAGRP